MVAVTGAEAKTAQLRHVAELKAAREEDAAVRARLEADVRAREADVDAAAQKIMVRRGRSHTYALAPHTRHRTTTTTECAG